MFRRPVSLILLFLTILNGAFSSYAAGTELGDVVSYNGNVYYSDAKGGIQFYLAYDKSSAGTDVSPLLDAYLSPSKLPGAQSGYGANAASAGLKNENYESRYGGSKYLFKYAAINYRDPGSGDPDLCWIDYGSPMTFVPRYIGLLRTSSSYTSSTNPYYPGDNVRESPYGDASVEVPIEYYEFKALENRMKTSHKDVYGLETDVYPLDWFYNNGLSEYKLFSKTAYSGSGNVKSNLRSAYNLDKSIAQKVFRDWAANDPRYGAVYYQYAEAWMAAHGYSTADAWKLLNNIFQINGYGNNIVLYSVMDGGGTAWYKTYFVPGSVEHNVAATFLGIRDESDASSKKGESYRDPTSVSEYGGLGISVETSNLTTPVVLERGKRYTIDGVFTFYSKSGGRTISNVATRPSNLYICAATNGKPISVSAQPYPVASVSNSYVYNNDVDGLTGGPVSAIRSATGNLLYQGMAFSAPGFMLPDDAPDSGYIFLSVPNAYAVYGDNDVLSDDDICIRYTISAVSGDSDIQSSPAFGDMNLGRREWRSYHHLVEVEPEDEEEDDGGSESGGPGGKEEKEPEIWEYYSEYGPYPNASAGAAAADPDGGGIRGEQMDSVPSMDGRSTFRIDDRSWWDYSSRIWPDQTEDAIWKCWVAKSGSHTYDTSNMYTRGMYQDFPFDLGFTVSRSKGDEGTVVNSPTVNVKLYGVSPDTGDEGELISETKASSAKPLGVYEEVTAWLERVKIGLAAGNDEYPRLRIQAEVSPDIHGESGIYGGAYQAPGHNGWEQEHDAYDWTIRSRMEDMRIVEVEIKDSEGIVIYHADRYNTETLNEVISGYYDREEDLSLKVVVEQCDYIGHDVIDPSIDVKITGLTESGNEISTYINTTLTNSGRMGNNVRTVFDGIYFRPKKAEQIAVSVAINEKHGADQWRENIWNDEEDSFYRQIKCTTADLALSQDIELFNSKGNPQDFITFAEYLDFRFNVRHIGSNSRQKAVVGGSAINPFININTNIYNADELTYTSPTSMTLMYKAAAIDDPKKEYAWLKGDRITTSSRLYPGLGTNGYATHVQTWIRDYVSQTWKTPTGNTAAYGHILVTGIIDEMHDYSNFNMRDNTVDYVQKEFKGEKNLKIVDLAATSRNSVSTHSGLSVQVAVANMASQYNDQTVVDKTYLDIYVDEVLKSTSIIEVPVGQTIVTEVPLDGLDLSGCKTIEARVNTGKHQTHYEYVLRETDTTLYADPFRDNYLSIVVCPNLPSMTVCPTCIIDEDDQLLVGDQTGESGTPVVPPVVSDNTDLSKYTVRFVSNSPAGESTTQQYDYNTTVALAENGFTYRGHNFKGWNTMADGSGKTYADQGVLTVNGRDTYYGNTVLTLYAQWTPKEITIHFDPNGGEGTMSDISFVYGKDDVLPECSFSNTGYVFSCWTTEPGGGGKVVNNREPISQTQIEDSVTLYAQWFPAGGCFVWERGLIEDAFRNPAPGGTVGDRVSIINLLDRDVYAYICVTVPTYEINGAVTDVFSPRFDSSNFTLVKEAVSNTPGVSSVYIYRYNAILHGKGESGDRSSDLFEVLDVDPGYNGHVSGAFELDGAVLYADGASVGNLAMPGITDIKAIGALMER